MEEISLDVKSESVSTVSSKNSNKAILYSIIAVISVILIIVIAIVVGSGGESKKKYEIINTNMTYEYSEYLGYSANITGTFKNLSNKDFSYVQVEFSVYDAAGNNLGTAIDNINNLSAGDTWKFDASLFSFPDTQPATYKLVDVSYW